MSFAKKPAVHSREIRCPTCGVMLCIRDRHGLNFERGQLRALITGAEFTVTLTCYRCHNQTSVVVTSS